MSGYWRFPVSGRSWVQYSCLCQQIISCGDVCSWNNLNIFSFTRRCVCNSMPGNGKYYWRSDSPSFTHTSLIEFSNNFMGPSNSTLCQEVVGSELQAQKQIRGSIFKIYGIGPRSLIMSFMVGFRQSFFVFFFYYPFYIRVEGMRY